MPENPDGINRKIRLQLGKTMADGENHLGVHGFDSHSIELMDDQESVIGASLDMLGGQRVDCCRQFFFGGY